MLTEDEKRIHQRNLTKKGNYNLNQTAKNAGVKNFDKFHNSGYKRLYNGETVNDRMPENLPNPEKSLRELDKEKLKIEYQKNV